MKRKGLVAGIGNAALFGVAAMSVSGCYFTARPATIAYSGPAVQVQPMPIQAQATVQVQAQPVVASGVTIIQQTCTPGANEQCNGMDDNCNGAIDEGCGYNTGSIQITLAWNSGADIDLYVTDPYAETISYQHTQSNSGGILDHDARGDCVASSAPTVENVYWTNSPPRGNYQVEIHNYSPCNVANGATQTTLSIAVGGQILGSYSYGIYPQQRIPVTSFQL